MENLGAFGDMSGQSDPEMLSAKRGRFGGGGLGMTDAMAMPMSAAPAPAGAVAEEAMDKAAMGGLGGGGGGNAGGEGGDFIQPTVRSQFADTAFWKGDITTDASGKARVELTMPENLTGGKSARGRWAKGRGSARRRRK